MIAHCLQVWCTLLAALMFWLLFSFLEELFNADQPWWSERYLSWIFLLMLRWMHSILVTKFFYCWFSINRLRSCSYWIQFLCFVFLTCISCIFGFFVSLHELALGVVLIFTGKWRSQTQARCWVWPSKITVTVTPITVIVAVTLTFISYKHIRKIKLWLDPYGSSIHRYDLMKSLRLYSGMLME